MRSRPETPSGLGPVPGSDVAPAIQGNLVRQLLLYGSCPAAILYACLRLRRVCDSGHRSGVPAARDASHLFWRIGPNPCRPFALAPAISVVVPHCRQRHQTVRCVFLDEGFESRGASRDRLRFDRAVSAGVQRSLRSARLTASLLIYPRCLRACVASPAAIAGIMNRTV